MNFSDQLRSAVVRNGPAKLGNHTILEISRSAPGIHAARPQTPFQSFLSRNRSLRYEQLQEHLTQHRTLIRIRCMRTTLHIVPVEIAKTLHLATLKQRLAKCASMAKAVPEYSKYCLLAKDWIREQLSVFGEINERQDEVLAEQKKGIPKAVFRLALKELWETGEVFFQDSSEHWHKERRTFLSTKPVFGDLLTEASAQDASEAIETLARLYFRAFGPATLSDFTWWSGLPKHTSIAAISAQEQSGLISTLQGGREFFHFADVSNDDHLNDEDLHLMPWEDYSLKAYFESRDRYGSADVLSRAYNSIGEVRRTVMFQGEIVGVWEVDNHGSPAEVNVFDKDKFGARRVRLAIERTKESILKNSAQAELFLNEVEHESCCGISRGGRSRQV